MPEAVSTSMQECIDYNYYEIGDGGLRRLSCKSKCYRLTQPDALGNNVIIKYDFGGRSYNYNTITYNLKDYRLNSYEKYYSNGKIECKFTCSADKSVETMMCYDKNGQITAHQIYNVQTGELTIKKYVSQDQSFEIKNDQLILLQDVEMYDNVSNNINAYKKGSKFKFAPISLNLKEYYARLLSCRYDEETHNVVLVAGALDPLSGSNMSTFIKNADAIDVQKEHKGKYLSISINAGVERMDAIVIEADIHLTKSTDSLSYYSMNYVSEYTEGYYTTIEATYKADTLAHITYKHNNPGNSKYYFDGDILNNQPHGKCTIERWNRGNGHGGKLVAQYIEGTCEKGAMYDADDNLIYEGEFKNRRYDGQGKLIKPSGEIQEGTFSGGELSNGKIIKPSGEIQEGIFMRSFMTEYKHALINGTHTQILSNGDLFAKVVEDGKYTQQGKLIKPNGDYFEGIFVDEKFTSGTCRQTNDNGDVYEGEITNEMYNGQGKLSKPNGDYENGTFANGVFVSGTCKKTLNNGDVYEGEISNNKYHGQGKLTRPDGDYFEGTFVEEQFTSGTCRQTNDNGDVYEGEISSNKYNGEGVLVLFPGDTIRGQFADGKSVGVCELKYANGSTYKGTLINCQPDGSGELFYSSGEHYIGNFAQGHRAGAGTLSTLSGSFAGVWEDDMKHGEFIVTTSEGDEYHVTFQHNIITKTASLYFANGDSFEGELENKEYKKGCYTFADGVAYDGTFTNGQVLKVKVRGADGKRIKGVTAYRQLNPINKIIFE